MEKQYVISERAHFMCPNMHFGILIQMNVKYSYEKICSILDLLAEAHPFLRSVIKSEDDGKKLYYAVDRKSKIYINEVHSNPEMWDEYNFVGKKDWNVFKNGLLKAFIYPGRNNFQVLFIAHHLLGDGRSLLNLVCEFADIYVKNFKPICIDEQLIKSSNDLPCGSNLSKINRWLVQLLNRQWQKEKKYVSYDEYASFAQKFASENPISHEYISLDEEEVKLIKKKCKENGITINDLLMSKLYIIAKTKKIIIAVDIRNKLKCYNKGSLGNYASAMSITCKKKNKEVFLHAKHVHENVKSNLKYNKKIMLILSCYLNMDPTLIDAAAISALGGFESKVAKFVGGRILGYYKRDGMSITNLGSITNKNMQWAMFIPPASPAMRQTIGVVTVNGNMQLCSSYYTKSVSKDEVKGYLEDIICCSTL